MAWGSTNKTKLNQLLRHQKHASRIIFFKSINSLSLFKTTIKNKLHNFENEISLFQ